MNLNVFTSYFMPLTCAFIPFNAIVGFTAANLARIKVFYDIAVLAGADVVIFPEMAITGYPLEDLTLNRQFQATAMQAMQALKTIATWTTAGTAVLIGGLWREEDAVYNAGFLLDGGIITHRQYKHHLPNYGVFDEKRIFTHGPLPEPFYLRGIPVGLMICEDMWLPGIATHLKQNGAQILISINASPYEMGKPAIREQRAKERVQESGLPLLYINQTGGQDDLVFDGSSFALTAQGTLCMRMQACHEEMALLRLEEHHGEWIADAASIHPQQSREESIYQALVMGLRDFVTKNGFSGVVLGLSGGIDSALSAAVAVDALGKERVYGIRLPSPVTSRESMDDAAECAALLSIRLETISIDAGMQGFRHMLADQIGPALFEMLAETNQTRLRAGILLAISQAKHFLLLNTGNKSEMAVGYTTIYGDMCGHFSVLKDLYKTTVYEIAHWRNHQGRVIPESILSKAPSAELRPNQQDQDTLPPYALLDAILKQFIEYNASAENVIMQGFERSIVEQISHMLFASEYKRRQSCPGVKISEMAFYRDRRYPVTSGWRGMDISLRHPLDSGTG